MGKAKKRMDVMMERTHTCTNYHTNQSPSNRTPSVSRDTGDDKQLQVEIDVSPVGRPLAVLDWGEIASGVAHYQIIYQRPIPICNVAQLLLCTSAELLLPLCTFGKCSTTAHVN